MIKFKEYIERFLNKPPNQQVKIILPYLIICIAISRVLELWRLCYGDIMKFCYNLDYLYSTIPNFCFNDVFLGSLLGIIIIGASRFHNKTHRKNMREGEEYGSSRWGTPDDIAPFIDSNPFNNIILSKTERLTMNPRMKKFSLNRNKHVIVYGGSGAGKTWTVVKSNLYQLHSNYVVTDPKGTLLPETGNLFYRKHFNIKVLDVIDFSNSMHYNPFHYIYEPKDILTLANALLLNLKEEGQQSPDPFWDKAALLYMQSVFGLLWYEAPPEEQNIPTFLEILEADEVMEDDDTYENAVDLLFKELEQKNPKHFAVKQRKKYKKAAAKTAQSILITLGAMFSAFDIPEVRELMMYDELELDTYGDPDKKTILYIILSDNDDTYNFIPSLAFTQMFNVLSYKADKVFGGKLKTPVQFIMDEFAQFKIPKFKYLIPSIRSRLMSCILMLQTQSQLKDNYKDAAETISGNCDTSIFLGGKEKSTLKDLEETLGDETIDLGNDTHSYGSNNDSTGMNYNKTGRKLKNIYELNTMDRDKCIVQISGLPPFYSDKYDTTQHPNYKYTADADEKNTFDFKKYKKMLKERSDIRIKFHHEDNFKVISL